MDFTEKAINDLKKLSEGLGNIKESCVKNINSNLGEIENLEQKEFLRSSMDSALNGNLSADEFIKQFKDLK